MKLNRRMDRGRRTPVRKNVRQTTPLITVLMPVYNGQKFVGEAVESILRQSWADFEFLIINDGSTDRTREILSSFRDPRIRLMDNPVNIGLTRSLNRGLAAAKGTLIARQDADDVSHPARLKAQVGFMQSNPDVALVGTQVHIIDERGRVSHPPGWERALTADAIRFQLMFDNAFIHTSVLFQREIIWDQLGGYNESFVTAQDFELWSRVAARYEVGNLPHPLIYFRFHADSLAARYGDKHLSYSQAVVAANLYRYLQLTHIPDKWPRLISGLHVNEPPGRETPLCELVAVADEIFDRFIECHSEVRDERELRRVLAIKMEQVAFRLAGNGHRRDAFKAYRRARSLRDRRSAKSSMPGFFARLLFAGYASVNTRHALRLALYRHATLPEAD